MGGETSFGPLKASSCLGQPGAGALQEISLEEDISSFPGGMQLHPWQGSSCCSKREKWKSNLMRNLISVLLGSLWNLFLNLFLFSKSDTSVHPPSFVSFSSTCVFMDFTFPALVFFFRKKTQPTPNPFFLFCHFRSPELVLLFFLFLPCHFSKVEEVWPCSS